ncbi:MAG TPA: SRPBCC family protein [Myxococcales bacterium LLY-WYZ-16_1]|jgi:uncharacterized protein YndB with AHSA1/START domain|nr:SRPBCC family protein [Myxococcales bacterium LLY-WYZ-16_1]
MRTVFRMLPILLLAGLGLAWLAGSWLPREKTVSRAVVVDRPISQVYRHLHRAAAWRAWYTGPDADVTVGGDPEGAGGTLSLVTDDGTTMRFELTETSSPTAVRYRHHPLDEPENAVVGRVELEPAGADRTRVRMAETGQAGAASMRWVLYMAGDAMVGAMLERTLHNLKSLAETGRTHPETPPGAPADPGTEASDAGSG